MNDKRNTTFDIAKAICAFMVVFIHAGENNGLETYFKVVCTCAVPFFFLLSGYYLSLNISAGKMEYPSRQFKKIWKLFIFTNVLYAIYISILMVIFHDDLAGFWKKALSLKSIVNFLVLNDSPFGFHLWYIGAQMVVLMIFALLILKNRFNSIVVYMPFLLVLAFVFGVYSKAIFKHDFPICMSRNFISAGLPSVAIGYMLPSIMSKHHRLYGYALPSVIVFSMAIILERFILQRLGILSTGSIFIMTVPLAVSMFIFAANAEHNWSSCFMKILANIGRYDSANIYIYHLLFVIILRYVNLSNNNIYVHGKPILIFILSLALSRGIYLVKVVF